MKTIERIKKLNWAEIRRKTKTLLLVIIFTSAAAFYAGVRYQQHLDTTTHHKVSEAVKAVSLKQASKQ